MTIASEGNRQRNPGRPMMQTDVDRDLVVEYPPLQFIVRGAAPADLGHAPYDIAEVGDPSLRQPLVVVEREANASSAGLQNPTTLLTLGQPAAAAATGIAAAGSVRETAQLCAISEESLGQGDLFRLPTGHSGPRSSVH